MLIRASILTQIVLLVARAIALVPSDTHVVDPAGIYGADEAMNQEILDAMDRFEDAGLELPELRVYVHDSDEPCNGNANMGLYNKGGDQQRIDLCHRSPNVGIHELAHAWEYHNMDDTTRQAFLVRADLSTWNDTDVVHRARGVERVAYAIVWGLDDQPIQRQLLSAYSENLDHFELLTGTPSPRIAHLAATANDGSTPTAVRLAVDLSDVVVEPNFQ